MKQWWRRRSLRVRLMLIGVVGLSVGLIAGGIALVATLGFVLQRSVDDEALAIGRQVADLVDAGSLPQPLPVTGAEQVQVVDAQGRVRSASVDADPLVPILPADELARARAGERLFLHGDRIGIKEGPVRVVAVPAGPANDPQTVIVARSMVDALRGLGALRSLLFVVFPLLIVALAVVAWRVIGATLRPVESLRRGAEEITGAGTSTRLPVPVGRDEIHRLAVTLNDMLNRLETGRTRQREFVGDAAHELRSPLTNMRTQLEVAQHLGPDADWSTVGEDLLADIKRLSRLVDDLLLLARADGSRELSRREPVDLAALARDVTARLDRVDLVDRPLWTEGNPDELRRVLANLVDNAVRHTRTRVGVATAAEGPRAVVTVTDDGPGIPAAERDRVFERFTRLDDSRARTAGNDPGGAGLGLAIVRELVRRHGGTVTLADADPADGTADPGLRVEVRLPILTSPH
jgi:signal transduction histidine kinase